MRFEEQADRNPTPRRGLVQILMVFVNSLLRQGYERARQTNKQIQFIKNEAAGSFGGELGLLARNVRASRTERLGVAMPSDRRLRNKSHRLALGHPGLRTQG